MDDYLQRLRAAVGHRFRLQRKLGEGGMGDVWLAQDVRLGRPVAIKFVHAAFASTPDVARRFVLEVMVTARFKHPNILPLLDAAREKGVLYCVMPYVQGGTLRMRLERAGRMQLHEALTVVRPLASALDYAHQHGVLHRDVKPENILFEDDQPLLADFGIAKVVDDAARTKNSEPAGTREYMSPECLIGDPQLDRTCDVYSLSCVLYEMLLGSPPTRFVRDHEQAQGAFQSLPPEQRAILDGFGRSVELALVRGLGVQPEDRPSTAGEFVSLVETGESGQTRVERPSSWFPLQSSEADLRRLRDSRALLAFLKGPPPVTKPPSPATASATDPGDDPVPTQEPRSPTHPSESVLATTGEQLRDLMVDDRGSLAPQRTTSLQLTPRPSPILIGAALAAAAWLVFADLLFAQVPWWAFVALMAAISSILIARVAVPWVRKRWQRVEPSEHTYPDLVRARQRCRKCALLANPADIDGGRFDSEQLGPFSRWQGNIAARLLVVDEAFADVDTFRRLDGRPADDADLNVVLARLMQQAGIPISEPRREPPQHDYFFTNAVLCLKREGPQQSIPTQYYRNCSKLFLRPLIELVRPRIVVSLGGNALNSVLGAFGLLERRSLKELVGQRATIRLLSRTILVPAFRPAPTVLNSARDFEAQAGDWRRIAELLGALPLRR